MIKRIAKNIKIEVGESYALKDDPNKFQCDIWTSKSEHHGVGATMAEAIFNAASHWREYEDKQKCTPTT